MQELKLLVSHTFSITEKTSEKTEEENPLQILFPFFSPSFSVIFCVTVGIFLYSLFLLSNTGSLYRQ